MAVFKFKDKKGWYFSFRFDGKQIKREKYNGEPMLSKSQAMQCEAELLRKLERERDMPITNLYELYDDFIANSKTSLKPSSLHTYEKFRKNHLILIEDKNLLELVPNDLLKWRNAIKELDSTSAYKNKLNNIMLAVLRYGNMMYNLNGKLQIPLLSPFKDHDIYKPSKLKYLPPKDFELLISDIDITDKDQYYYYTILNVLYYTGLRIGELSALLPSDYSNHSLSVTKDYIRVSTTNYVQAPKNSNSIRVVPLDPTTDWILARYVAIFAPHGTLFHKEGEYLNQQRLRRKIDNLARATGLDNIYLITPHTLRHSHATNLKSLGFSAIDIARRLGNTPDVSASVYIHSTDDIQQNIANKLREE